MAGEEDNGWDGGWDALIDDGHAFADEVLMGPVHRYDRDDHYVPAPRWESRNEIVSRRHDDPIDAIDAGGTPYSRVVVSAGAPGRRGPVARKRPGTPPRKPPATGVKQASHGERTQAVARRLGTSVEVVQEWRRRRVAAELATKGLSKAKRSAAVAKHMGVAESTVMALRQAEAAVSRDEVGPARRAAVMLSRSSTPAAPVRSTGMPPPPSSRTAVRPAPPVTTTRESRPKRKGRNLPPIPNCGACGRPISVSGYCGC